MTRNSDTAPPTTETARPAPADTSAPKAPEAGKAAEIGGRQGPEPTRYGDWEKDGRCVDF